MSSRRAEDVPLDPADVEDMRLRIEAHQRAADAEAASAKAFRSECERAHGEFLRAIARLEEERRARHAKQLEEMEVTYARARLARPAVSAEVIALRGLAQDIARGLAAREPARCGTPRPPEEGNFVRPEEADENSDAFSASDRFALAALERAASAAETKGSASYDARITGDMQMRFSAIKKAHDRETAELARACGDAERTVLDARTEASSRRFHVADAEKRKTRAKPVAVALVTDAVARAARAATAAARAIAERSEEAHVETLRDAAQTTRRARDGVAARNPRGEVPGPPERRRRRLVGSAAEKARRVELAARASFAKVDRSRDASDVGRAREKPFRDRFGRASDLRRAGVLVFGPEDAAFAGTGADDAADAAAGVAVRNPYVDALVDDDDERLPGEGGGRSMASAQIEGEGASSSSSSVVEDDDEDEFVTTRIRFAAPGNRRRRQSRARARVGEARVAALGARGDDSKGFGVLGEQGVAFAAAGPAGRRRRDVARSRSPLLERCLDATPPSPKEGVARAPRGDDGDFRKGPFAIEPILSRVDVDDGFGLARGRGSGLRLPPPPASLPRAAEAPSLSRVIHDRRVAAARARGAATTIREARRGLGEKTWR